MFGNSKFSSSKNAKGKVIMSTLLHISSILGKSGSLILYTYKSFSIAANLGHSLSVIFFIKKIMTVL
jgi:hypothetical protein